MSSTIIGKRLLYEGDKALKEKNYNEAIKKYLNSKKEGYFSEETQNKLSYIANCINNSDIEEKDLPNLETLIELGEELLFRANNLNDEIGGMGYLTLLNFIPEEKLSRDTIIYMRYLADLDI